MSSRRHLPQSPLAPDHRDLSLPPEGQPLAGGVDLGQPAPALVADDAGGFLGTVLAGVFAAKSFGGLGLPDGVSIGSQVGTQLLAALITIAYTAVASFVLLKLTGMVVSLRVEDTDERMGLDLSLHEEAGYNL